MLPSSDRRATNKYSTPLLSRAIRQANGSFCVMPLFFRAQVFPPFVLLYTPRPNAATYKVRESEGLVGSRRMCVAADCSIPSLDFDHVLPPSWLMQTPPRYFATPPCRHIFGRGKS